ncbi:MAG: hypothetical protein VKL39_18195 [Leptolyngbyaceae bacterium]|nr:hypothetical protein [Leptolyngbyaceae bacterium]
MMRSEHPPIPVMHAHLMCTQSDFVIYNQDGEACDRLENLAPITLSTTLTFSDTANDELVKLLMPAQLALKATFYAKQLHPGHDVVLGSVILNTVPGMVSYDVELEIPDLAALGLSPNTTYHIGATLRLGTAPYGVSSFLRGDLEGMQLTIGTPVVNKHTLDESVIDESTEKSMVEEEPSIDELAIEESPDILDDSPDSGDSPEDDTPSANAEGKTSSTDTQKSTSSRRKRTKKTA